MGNCTQRQCEALRPAISLIVVAMCFAVSPAICRGQFGGVPDSQQTSLSVGLISSSLPLKDVRGEQIEREILAALSRNISLNLNQTPLQTFVHRVSHEAGIQVQLDDKALREANVAVDAPLTLRVSNVPIRSVLNMVLQQFDLKWVIANDMLTITTKDVADDTTEVRVYPVRDLVVFGNGFVDYDSLIDLLQNTIKPDSWTATGGPGAAEKFPRNYSLVISQTREVHEQIDLLLTQLRRAGDRYGVSPQPGPRSTVREHESSAAASASSPARVYTRTATSGLVRVHP